MKNQGIQDMNFIEILFSFTFAYMNVQAQWEHFHEFLVMCLIVPLIPPSVALL